MDVCVREFLSSGRASPLREWPCASVFIGKGDRKSASVCSDIRGKIEIKSRLRAPLVLIFSLS